MSNQLEQWVAGVVHGVHPADAATELTGSLLPSGDDDISTGIRAVASVLIAIGVPIERAVERARNLAMALADGEEPVLETIRDIMASEQEAMRHRVERQLAVAWLRATGRELI